MRYSVIMNESLSVNEYSVSLEEKYMIEMAFECLSNLVSLISSSTSNHLGEVWKIPEKLFESLPDLMKIV